MTLSADLRKHLQLKIRQQLISGFVVLFAITVLQHAEISMFLLKGLHTLDTSTAASASKKAFLMRSTLMD